MDRAIETCGSLATAVEGGASIAFHCHAGRGRTGTLLAAMLIWYAPDFNSAIRRIKRTNRYWIESSSQLKFLEKFEQQRKAMLGIVSKAIHRTGTGPDAASQGKEERLDTVSDPSKPGKPSEVNKLNSEKGTNMSLEKALQTAMTSVPEYLASGYVDMESGMLIGIQTVDAHPQEVLDLLAAATADLFQGSSVVQIENIFKGGRGSKDENQFFREPQTDVGRQFLNSGSAMTIGLDTGAHHIRLDLRHLGFAAFVGPASADDHLRAIVDGQLFILDAGDAPGHAAEILQAAGLSTFVSFGDMGDSLTALGLTAITLPLDECAACQLVNSQIATGGSVVFLQDGHSALAARAMAG